MYYVLCMYYNYYNYIGLEVVVATSLLAGLVTLADFTTCAVLSCRIAILSQTTEGCFKQVEMRCNQKCAATWTKNITSYRLSDHQYASIHQQDRFG